MPITTVSKREKEVADREAEASRVIQIVLGTGRFSNGRFEMSLDLDSHDIKVRDLKTSYVVAYSSTRADFEQSLVEFATDYFV